MLQPGVLCDVEYVPSFMACLYLCACILVVIFTETDHLHSPFVYAPYFWI